MKTLVTLLIAVTVFPRTFPTQGVKPIPPGIREADKQPGPADIPPRKQPKNSPTDPVLMQEQARELSALAQTIPTAIAQFNSGALPKDMSEKLKRIEKLSKTLRGEMAR
jgi:hypothetical protein